MQVERHHQCYTEIQHAILKLNSIGLLVAL